MDYQKLIILLDQIEKEIYVLEKDVLQMFLFQEIGN